MSSRLIDGFGRVHDDLRVSVTDRCNLRCAYCMPEDPVWYPRERLLSYEELLRIVELTVRLGIRAVRVTGGEPLVRRDLPWFVERLARIPGVEDLSLTTNGVLLGRLAEPLARAGLRRVNVSLDTLDPQRFRALTRRDLLGRVLDGLAEAGRVGLAPVKVNTVLVRGQNDDEVESLAEHAREHGWELRFIERMPLGNDGRWEPESVVRGDEVRRRIAARWPIEPDAGATPGAPATRYRYSDGRGRVGFIDSVSRPFCGDCGRLRLTADGALRACLYDTAETDLKTPLRAGADDARLASLVSETVRGKGRGGALDLLERRAAPELAGRTMHQIGG